MDWAAQVSPRPHPDLSPAWQDPFTRDILGCGVGSPSPQSVNAWGSCLLFPGVQTQGLSPGCVSTQAASCFDCYLTLHMAVQDTWGL